MGNEHGIMNIRFFATIQTKRIKFVLQRITSVISYGFWPKKLLKIGTKMRTDTVLIAVKLNKNIIKVNMSFGQ